VAGSRFAPAIADSADRACREQVPSLLRASLSQWLDGEESSVWIVRRIDVSLAIGTQASSSDIASSVVKKLGQALAATLTADGDGVNAVRFSSRAAYLARFIADVASGTAWSRWYFVPFSGWRLLPASATIRSALVENPVEGLSALQSLDERELGRVVDCLAPTDERIVLAAIASALPDGTRERERAVAGSDEAAVVTSRINEARRRPLFEYVRSNAAAVTVRPGADNASTTSTNKLPRVADDADACVETQFGGTALLLRDLDALPWLAGTTGWPDAPAGMSQAALMKWLVSAMCQGRARTASALSDAAWRDLFAVPSDITMRDVACWLRSLGDARRQQLAVAMEPLTLTRSERAWLGLPRTVGIGANWSRTLASIARLAYRNFAQRLPGFAQSSPEYVWRNFLDFDAVISIEEERVVVYCGRPPLHLFLTLTGMTRGMAAGTDAHGRPVLVFTRTGP